MRKPFYWKQRDAWYVKSADHRRNLFLSVDEKEAYELWNEMLKAGDTNAGRTIVAVVVQEFLKHTKAASAATTYDRLELYLIDFAKSYGFDLVRQLKPIHVTRWLHDHASWGVSSQRGAIAAVKQAMNWSEEQGLIEKNPVSRVRKPKATRREVLIAEDSHTKIMLAADKNNQVKRRGAFRTVLIALRNSGVRPGTVGAVEAQHITNDGQTWMVPEHKNRKKTGRPLTVYLSPCLQTLSKILAHHRPEGPLFLNHKKKRWTPNAIRCRMRRLRETLELPAGYVAYGYRHTYITNALMSGNNTATVAELVGHADGTMIARYYGHLDQQKEHLIAAAARVTKPKPR